MDEIDIPPAKRWRDELEKAIEQKDYFFLLRSPESDKSENVGKELQHAKQHKPADHIWQLRIAGDSHDTGDQAIDFRTDYEAGLRKTLASLNVDCPDPLSASERLHLPESVEDARKMFPDHEHKPLPVSNRQVVDSPRRNFVRIPLQACGYAASWLVVDAEGNLRQPPDDLQVVLKFTGTPDRTLKQVLSYLVTSGIEPHILYIEGPRTNNGDYELPNNDPHVWRDCVDFAAKSIETYCGQQPVRYFMDAPQALVFSIAAGFHVRKIFHVYNLNTHAADETLYSCVYSK